MALATGSAFGPVTAAAMPIALGKMVLPRFGASTRTAFASDAGFRRNDVEADSIGNGCLSGRKRSQASNRLFGGDFAVYSALDIAKGQAGIASDWLETSDVDACNG